MRESFYFPPTLYPYIFRGIEDVPGGRPTLVRRTVEWNGTQQPYYQEEAQRRLFYYLPDAFKIARRAAPVRAPEMEISVTSPDGSLEKTYSFSNYYETIAFVNAVAFIANAEDHHPDLALSYGKCTVRFNTHDVQGISVSDFFCASKVDALLA